jgi:diaminohydroxyphosphoribosylaminopyrimidine deaminase/5-amino-6-(5-phosphoribosylamino)uracil reductase
MASPPGLDDEHWMRLALRLAAKGQGRVEPNPMVGCVLVKQGACIAQGYHHFFGGPHAEADALQTLSSASDAAGATVYVTLEPCCHQGKTPPCSLALIKAKVSRVVIAMRDPFPQVDGGGIGQLREAGIEVTVDVLKEDAEALNAPYLKRLETGMPWVIAKWAMTIDGRIATTSGESQWISGARSRHQVHLLRSRVDAIVVGTGTVIADDPLLNARLLNARLLNARLLNARLPGGDLKSSGVARVAKRVVLCRNRLPPRGSKLIQTAAELETWLMTSPRVDPAELKDLEDAGVRVFRLRTDQPHPMIRDSLVHLGDRGMTNVMIEGGPGVLGSFVNPSTGACLVDECHVYVGSKLFGGESAPGPVGGEGIARIDLAPAFTLRQVDRFDDDVRMIYRRA